MRSGFKHPTSCRNLKEEIEQFQSSLVESRFADWDVEHIGHAVEEQNMVNIEVARFFHCML